MAEATPPTNQPDGLTIWDLQRGQAVPTVPVTMLDNSGLY